MSVAGIALQNPVLCASGTFGYGIELEPLVHLDRLGGLVGKTLTAAPRRGNAPPRTFETPAGMLNSIGLENPGIEAYCEEILPRLQGRAFRIFANVAGEDARSFAGLVRRLDRAGGVDGIELNLSCPNVAGGLDFSTDPRLARDVVAACRAETRVPLFAKLTPNVTDPAPIAVAAREGGADGLTCVNTVLGMAVDWRRRASRLSALHAGLSGPAIRPIALRIVDQVRRAAGGPILAAGGIASAEDALEFLVAGASAVQVGTASFVDITAPERIAEDLPGLLASASVRDVNELIGTLKAR